MFVSILLHVFHPPLLDVSENIGTNVRYIDLRTLTFAFCKEADHFVHSNVVAYTYMSYKEIHTFC